MKLLIVLALIAVAINFAAGIEYIDAIRETSEAFPGLINGPPPKIIKVIFDNGAFADLGKNITPTETKNQPLVDWEADKDSYYTLIITDPDAVDKNNPALREAVLWLVVNIPGKDVNAGESLYEYIAAAPTKHFGPNRYFYLLFKQSGKSKFKNEPRVTKFSAIGRTHFSIRDFAANYNLGSPVGLNYFTASYDPYSAIIYKQLKCCEEFM